MEAFGRVAEGLPYSPGAFAEFERHMISQRVAVGIKRARAKGVKFGRKPKLTPHQQEEARKRIATDEPQRSIARSYNVSQATISRLIGS